LSLIESIALLVERGGLYSFLEGHPGVKILDGTTRPLFFFFLLFFSCIGRLLLVNSYFLAFSSSIIIERFHAKLSYMIFRLKITLKNSGFQWPTGRLDVKIIKQVIF